MYMQKNIFSGNKRIWTRFLFTSDANTIERQIFTSKFRGYSWNFTSDSGEVQILGFASRVKNWVSGVLMAQY